MTLKRQSGRSVFGIALLALFLGFLAISAFQSDGNGPGAGTVTTVEANVAEPHDFRNTTSPNLIPRFSLKAIGPCLLLALFGVAIISPTVFRVSALRLNLPRHNPFYVVVTTNAP